MFAVNIHRSRGPESVLGGFQAAHDNFPHQWFSGSWCFGSRTVAQGCYVLMQPKPVIRVPVWTLATSSEYSAANSM
jgi:hypothetical protein